MQLTAHFKPESRLSWFIGETLVIVVGVLIALALDDFWTNRQERALEADYLSRIESDINADIAYIKDLFRDSLEIKLQALETIAPVVRGREPVPDDVESFLRNVALGGLIGASSTQWITDTTFEDLKSTGNLRLIRDPALRWKISRYYHEQNENFERARDRQTAYVAYVHSFIPAELRDDMTIEAMSAFGTERAIERALSAEFQDVLNQELNYAYFMTDLDQAALSHQLLRDLQAYRTAAADDP